MTVTPMHHPPLPPASPPPPPQGTERDRALLDLALGSQVQVNKADAARLAAIMEFHARRVAEHNPSSGKQAAGASARFAPTPLRQTMAEFGPMLGVSDFWIQVQLDTTTTLAALFPKLWHRCLTGRLDVYRASVVLTQLVHLAEEHHAAYAQAVSDWFDVNDALPAESPLCTLTRDQIHRAAVLRRRKLPPRPSEQSFAQAYARRRVSLRIDEETAMATLSATTAAHDAMTADYRLTQIAQRLSRNPEETRTLEQLRVDALLGLIHGTLSLASGARAGHAADPSTEEPEAAAAARSDLDDLGVLDPDLDTDADADDLAWHTRIGAYARPVINVTVPISTLLGLTNDPGTLAGGHVIPGDYARHLAAMPGATWYRMLTDDAGEFLHLSTTSYQPTPAIWRTTTARNPRCTWPTCRRPSVRCDIDHRIPHPQGPTCICNTHPLCEKHHLLKHAPGYHVRQQPDGTTTWTTRYGGTHLTPRTEHPHGHWPDPCTVEAIHDIT